MTEAVPPPPTEPKQPLINSNLRAGVRDAGRLLWRGIVWLKRMFI
jgi:hypothetical protein